ncbi:MAG: VIT1/CCC1 transporter family protein [Myxococcota bacterium]
MSNRIQSRHPQQHAPRWWWNVREIVLGANDGLVSTLAFVAGAAAAVAEPDVILLATVIEVVAGSISMGFGAWVASRSRSELERSEIAIEKQHLVQRPREEQDELEAYLRSNGVDEEDTRRISEIAARNPALLLSMMGGLELGVQAVPESPTRAGSSMAAAFVLGAMPPALPFLFVPRPYLALAISVGLSVCFLMAVGFWRSHIGASRPGRAVAEMILVGALATATGYFLGHLAAAMLG